MGSARSGDRHFSRGGTASGAKIVFSDKSDAGLEGARQQDNLYSR
jgi:hypothetical protein